MQAANDMEAAIGVDRQLTKTMTGNVTYIFSASPSTVHRNLSAASVFPLRQRRPVSILGSGWRNPTQRP